MATRYRLDPTQGRFTVQAFAPGLLSFLGHSPVFAVREYRGEVRLDHQGPGTMSVEIVVQAGSLALQDASSASDRREVQERMNREVLEVAGYPEIRYTVHLKGDGTPEQMRKIHDLVIATSPNRFNLANPIALKADLVIE